MTGYIGFDNNFGFPMNSCNNNGCTKIVMIEDNRGYRDQLRSSLDQKTDWCVVGSFADSSFALSEIRQLKPDLILLDVRLPGLMGTDALPQIKKLAPAANIMMVTVDDSPETIFRALESGANGYLLKGGSEYETISAIETFLEHGGWMSPGVALKVIERMRQRQSQRDPSDFGLTDRQWEIMQLIKKGKQRGEVALALGISLNTVKNHLQNIFEKLRVSSQMEALRKIDELNP